MFVDTQREQHCCDDIDNFPLDKFFQKGKNRGERLLIVGESPAENGWRKTGKACYSPEGRLLATGARLNELLEEFGLSVENCGFTELSKCFLGKNRKKLDECCRKCWPILLKQLLGTEYRLIITLGVVTAKIFGELAGKDLEIGKSAIIELADKTRTVLPIYHPSPINPWGRERNRKIFAKYRVEIGECINN